jgi:hypothetical protein
MSNNKQSSVEGLAVRLKEKMQVWNFSKNHQEFHIILEAGEFAKLIDEAKEMEVMGKEMSYSDGYREGYKRALDYMTMSIKNAIETKDK